MSNRDNFKKLTREDVYYLYNQLCSNYNFSLLFMNYFIENDD